MCYFASGTKCIEVNVLPKKFKLPRKYYLPKATTTTTIIIIITTQKNFWF